VSLPLAPAATSCYDSLRMSEPSPNPRRGAVAVIVRQGRLLVVRRSQWVEAPHTCCFPGGAIEGTESEQQALVRELDEELGLEVRPVRRLWQSLAPWNVLLYWWLAEMEADAVPKPNPAEVESVRWCTPQEMAALPDLLVSNRHFLEAFDRGEFDLPL